MAAAPGIVTTGSPPNAVVQVQGGMNIQPVVLVDQNGNYQATSGSAATAGFLADLTGTVHVANATAPTAGQVLTATGASAATWQGVSGQYLCAPTQYAPATRATNITTSATMAAVSSGNINTGTWIAPASGSVVVTTALVASIVTPGDHMGFGLAAHGTTSPMVSNEWIFAVPGSSPLPYVLQFLVTGLTAGTSYNLDLMFSSPDSVTVTTFSLGQSGTAPTNAGGAPTTMTVQAV